MLDRTVQPGVVLMQPDTVLAPALKAYGVVVLPLSASASAHGMLADVLALANGSTPDKWPRPRCAGLFCCARPPRVELGGAALAVGGAWLVLGPGCVSYPDGANQLLATADQPDDASGPNHPAKHCSQRCEHQPHAPGH